MRKDGVTRRSESGVTHVLLAIAVVVAIVLVVIAIVDSQKPSKSHRTASGASSPSTQEAPLQEATTPIDAGAVARSAGPAVVRVDVTFAGGGRASASGMVLTPAGEVLTNNHAIAGATAIAVRVGDNGRTYSATVAGYDITDDVAVLALTGASSLPTINLADSATVHVADPVVALGRAAGTGNELTHQPGSVTALHQQIHAGDSADPSGVENLHDMVQVDAPTRPSDSGGAIVDAHGKVIGMSTGATAGRRFAEQASAVVTFAVPIDVVVAVADRVDAGESTDTVHVGPAAALGITVVSESSGASAGVFVVTVQPGGPAAAIGVVPNAVIASIDDANIASDQDLDTALSRHSPGDVVHVSWADPNGMFHTAPARLTSGPPA